MLVSRLTLLIALVSLSGCTEFMVGSHLFKKGMAADSCRQEGDIKVGNPYMIDGQRYEPTQTSWGYSEQGIASWYGDDFHGKATANGECYNMYAFTAAHRTLPLPTVVRVTNLENRKSIVVKVNDRGPYARSRILDLSYAAAQSLGVVRNGTAPVLVEAIGGPHYDPNGYAGYRRKNKNVELVGNDRRTTTLPSMVPSTVAEEDLAPTSFTNRVSQKASQAPAPDTSLPPPPAPEDRTWSSTQPLEHTKVYIQVGAFSELTRAEGQQTALSQVEKSARIQTLQSGDKTLHKVRSGPYKTVAEAESRLAKLVSQGFTGAQIKVEK